MNAAPDRAPKPCTSPAEADAPLQDRASFPHVREIPTRWMDNDTYGHVNNVVYYSYFDTVANAFLIEKGGLDIQADPVIGLVVETKCTYRKPLTFPDIVAAGLRVRRMGRSSVTYEIGLFRGDDTEPAAFGYFVHVYVDRESRRPVPVPEKLRRALEPILAT
ncbi:acyl-CoA thioesterase [Marinibaculum pumilum]|uniref:Acyl-CoA thioesterase n=1 Tax=Marinibaculum pumilum TaxID=1766165 RepID=A0ABV7KWK8_9PROT